MKRFALLMVGGALALGACHKEATTNDAAMNDGMTVNDTMTNDMSATNDMGTTAATGTADTAFLTEAIKGDNSEVAIGNLAATQGMSAAAKDFGKMLAADHGAHKVKAAALLTGAGGTSTDALSDEGQATLDKLKALKGADFDKAFKTAMVEDHNKDIAKNEKQAAGTDAAIAQLAKDTLPTLKKHLAAAQAL